MSHDELNALILEYEGKVYAIFEEYERKYENFKNLVSFESYLKILVKEVKGKSNRVDSKRGQSQKPHKSTLGKLRCTQIVMEQQQEEVNKEDKSEFYNFVLVPSIEDFGEKITTKKNEVNFDFDDNNNVIAKSENNCTFIDTSLFEMDVELNVENPLMKLDTTKKNKEGNNKGVTIDMYKANSNFYNNNTLTYHSIDNVVQKLHKLENFDLDFLSLIPLERGKYGDFNEDEIESDDCGKKITHKEHNFL